MKCWFVLRLRLNSAIILGPVLKSHLMVAFDSVHAQLGKQHSRARERHTARTTVTEHNFYSPTLNLKKRAQGPRRSLLYEEEVRPFWPDRTLSALGRVFTGGEWLTSYIIMLVMSIICKINAALWSWCSMHFIIVLTHFIAVVSPH